MKKRTLVIVGLLIVLASIIYFVSEGIYLGPKSDSGYGARGYGECPYGKNCIDLSMPPSDGGDPSGIPPSSPPSR